MVSKAQIRGIVRLQAALGLVASVLIFLLWGQWAAIASVIGAAISLAGSLIYTKAAYQLPYGPPALLMKLHYMGEALKLVFTLVCFGVVFRFYRQVVWPAVFAGYLAAASAFWFGLLIKFKDKK
ncbi:ATP synthase subunit I [Amantichitinum ursilacus]|uniref:F0F1 ATP synthase subunit I n=1 Tax=Amantichitinum ursilacus TaxID=857265 RepID=A0A0N0GN76_9NEIS|nr:ATP synthase subunit I [Amantichitinum ursilacus]KPC52190.1 F0F1 ATP synthase subunit I [Amantichitinum ursilacus]